MLDLGIVVVLLFVVIGLIGEVNGIASKINRPKRKYTKDMTNKRWHKGGIVKKGRGRPRKTAAVI